MKISWDDGPVLQYSATDGFLTYYQQTRSVGGLEGGSKSQYSLTPFPPVSPDWDETIRISQIILVPASLALPLLKNVAGRVRPNRDFYEPYVSVSSPNMLNTYTIPLFVIEGEEYLGFYTEGRRTVLTDSPVALHKWCQATKIK